MKISEEMGTVRAAAQKEAGMSEEQKGAYHGWSLCPRESVVGGKAEEEAEARSQETDPRPHVVRNTNVALNATGSHWEVLSKGIV